MAQVTGKQGNLSKGQEGGSHESTEGAVWGTPGKLSSKAQEIASQPHHEGQMTRRIEQQTAKIPSIGFLGLAMGSMVASAALAFFAQKKELATFVGLWAPSLLLIGVYNKLVKIEAEGGFGQQGSGGRRRRDENVSGQSYSQGYGTSQGYSSQGYTGQGATEQGITGQGYTGV
jgi:hypothetical protein